MTLKVPLTGTAVKSEGAGPAVGATDTPAPAQTQDTQPTSLHQVRMPAQQAQAPELTPQWDNHGRVKWVQAEPTQDAAQQVADEAADIGEQPDATGVDALAGVNGTPPLPGSQSNDVGALQQQIASLTQTVTLLAQAQLKGMQPPAQKPQPPQAPDPAQFDFYDPASSAEFYRLNNAYIQATVRHEVNEALAPHGNALQDAELNRQYNGLYAQFGQESNFKERMGTALQLMTKLPGVTMQQAFDAAGGIQSTSPRQTATPSQSVKPARTITAQEAAQKAEQAKKLPASNGVSGTAEPTLPNTLRNVGALGRIMLHNQQSGRARPI